MSNDYFPNKVNIKKSIIQKVTLSCGQSSSENNTYFDSGANEGGHVKEGVCKAEICPCRENICQVEID